MILAMANCEKTSSNSCSWQVCTTVSVYKIKCFSGIQFYRLNFFYQKTLCFNQIIQFEQRQQHFKCCYFCFLIKIYYLIFLYLFYIIFINYTMFNLYFPLNKNSFEINMNLCSFLFYSTSFLCAILKIYFIYIFLQKNYSIIYL